MYNLCNDKELEKEVMVKDILEYSDLYKNKRELLEKDYSSIKSLYHSCLIPLLKGGYMDRIKSFQNR